MTGGLKDALEGFDFRRALVVLQEAMVLPAAGGEKAKSKRLGGSVRKVYEIYADKLAEPVTPVTAAAVPDVTEKTLPIKDVTLKRL